MEIPENRVKAILREKAIPERVAGLLPQWELQEKKNNNREE
ncbi:MAG TPA: hypothetical protein VGD31_06780 [Sphingobacteriaceae bacterium]